jgi:hypothetical protein
MAGMGLDTGLTGSVVGRLYTGRAAQVPMAGIPEGGTISEAAYGAVPGVNEAPASSPGIKAAVVGGICLGLLVFIWWGLPR